MNAGGMLNTCKSYEKFACRLLVADGCVTRKNLPLDEGQPLETMANTSYAEKWKEESI